LHCILSIYRSPLLSQVDVLAACNTRRNGVAKGSQSQREDIRETEIVSETVVHRRKVDDELYVSKEREREVGK
jgi:hypothetical protein